MTTREAIIMFDKKEELFLRFLYSYLTFLIDLCRLSLNTCDQEGIECEKLEMSLMNSLTRIWQMHVGFFLLKSFYTKADDIHELPLTFTVEQSERMIPHLREMKRIIKCLPHIKKLYKRHYLSMIEQINSYYQQGEYVIVKAESHADPWLGKFLKPK